LHQYSNVGGIMYRPNKSDLTTLLHQHISNITMGLANFVENSIENVILLQCCITYIM